MGRGCCRCPAFWDGGAGVVAGCVGAGRIPLAAGGGLGAGGLEGPSLGCVDVDVGVGVDVDVDAEVATRPGGAPAKMTSPPWSHSSSQSAETVTSAAMKGLRKAVYRIGAVEVSRDGGFLQRSVLGGAARLKKPISGGSTESGGQFSAVNDELSGGIVRRLRTKRR